MPKATKTEFYIGGRQTERPQAIQQSINYQEEAGWTVREIIMGMGGMWVVYEKDQK